MCKKNSRVEFLSPRSIEFFFSRLMLKKKVGRAVSLNIDLHGISELDRDVVIALCCKSINERLSITRVALRAGVSSCYSCTISSFNFFGASL